MLTTSHTINELPRLLLDVTHLCVDTSFTLQGGHYFGEILSTSKHYAFENPNPQTQVQIPDLREC